MTEHFIHYYASPLGNLLLAADSAGLFGLWFEEQKYYAEGLNDDHEERLTPALEAAVRWLDEYFAQKVPAFTPPLHLVGSGFQQSVWKVLQGIPYGALRSYGEIAQTLMSTNRLLSMSAQAVGGAVARNRISIIIPCHRVVASDGSLTGYSAGLDKKQKLLSLEKAFRTKSLFPE